MRLACLAALMLAACAPQQAPRGGEELPTIVSLHPCADAVLAEIADPAQVLAISHYSHDPRASSMDLAVARRYRATGGTVEEVLALDPDIVVATAFMPPATRAAFDDLGIRVETYGLARTVDEGLDVVERLGEAIGRADEGRRLAREIAAASAAASAPDGAAPIATVLWQPGGIVPGEDVLLSDMLRRAGFASVSAARGMGQADYLPLEQVLADPPALLLVAGSTPAQRHPALAQLPGMRIERLSPSLFYCDGPVIPRAMERLAGIRSNMSPRARGDLGQKAERQTDGDPRLRGGSAK